MGSPGWRQSVRPWSSSLCGQVSRLVALSSHASLAPASPSNTGPGITSRGSSAMMRSPGKSFSLATTPIPLPAIPWMVHRGRWAIASRAATSRATSSSFTEISSGFSSALFLLRANSLNLQQYLHGIV